MPGGYRTSDLYDAAAIIWKTGIYPDGYSDPDSRGIVSVVWNNDQEIRETVNSLQSRCLLVCPRGLKVIHINLKRKVNSIKGAKNR